MMYSTQKNITTIVPKTNIKNICGKYLQYPLTDNTTRLKEGGLRTLGKYKENLANKPLLTVITVVYNREQSLEKCILSVLEQDYDNVEYIIIDGGSTDGTLDIIKKYENVIDYYVSEADKGIYDAMNKGLSLAIGEAINFMNSDDYFLLTNSLSLYGDKIKAGYKIISANTEVRDQDDNIAYIFYNTFEHCMIRHSSHQALLISCEVFNILGNFNKSYKMASDNELFLRASEYFGSERFAYIDQVTVSFSLLGESNIQEQNVSRDELDNLHWKHYGKPLGLDFNVYSTLISPKFKSKNHQEILVEISTLREKLFESFTDLNESKRNSVIFFLLSIHYTRIEEYQEMIRKHKDEYMIESYERNWWYAFSKLSLFKKIIKIFLLIIKTPFLLVKIIVKKLSY